MQFQEKRRQQFLIEERFLKESVRITEDIAYFSMHPVGSGASELHKDALARLTSAEHSFDLLTLKYTAGEPIEPLRDDLENVIAAYECYGEYLWQYEGDRNIPVFDFVVIDDYCQLMQIIGLCFLLHRRDLLPRLAALQDGVDGAVGGADWLFEEFMAYVSEERYESEQLCCSKPYKALAEAMSTEDNDAALKEMHRFLKRWYKDLAGCGWHDSHRPDDNGNQGGYYGYWSFEAGAAVVLLGIKDDSSLHQYLYYPKDLVAWCRANAHLSEQSVEQLRCPGGEPCPKEGFWWTPAKPGSGRVFKKGEIMPKFQSDYGATIWQLSSDHSEN